MKKVALIFLFSFLINSSVLSQSNWQFKAGPNYTYYSKEKNSLPKIGYLIGIAENFNIYKNLSIYGELNYTTRGAILKDRKIRPMPRDVQPQDTYTWDIHGYIGYLELPILLSSTIPFLKEYKIRLFIGPCFSSLVKDLSRCYKKSFIEYYDPLRPSKTIYEYAFLEESAFGHNNIPMIYIFGFEVLYSSYSIEFRYLLNSKDKYYFDTISSVHDKLNTFQLLIGLSL